ncbi:NARE ribosyltransferase, partial [Baryphthengus martii]|nr:NARE ribosyltransferase [Baryphthengus martii]
MEHIALGLVLLIGTLATGSPLHQRDLITVKEMDMAPTSFDDQYQGCTSMMEEELAELNRTEFNKNPDYAEAWTEAAREWWNNHGHGHQTLALRSEQAIALLAYTREGPMYKKFNEAVRMAGSSREYYLDNFHFKVLHFLLTEALRALRDARPRHCYNVYRGVRNIYFTAQQHQSFRFGQFTSSSLKENVAKSFGQDTFFSVETCYGVPMENYSYFPEEEEVLIPPFESFEVTKVTHDGYRSFINLRSKDAKSTYNCEFVKEKRCKSLPCVFSAGDSISEEPPRLWLLLLAAAVLAVRNSP